MTKLAQDSTSQDPCRSGRQTPGKASPPPGGRGDLFWDPVSSETLTKTTQGKVATDPRVGAGDLVLPSACGRGPGRPSSSRVGTAKPRGAVPPRPGRPSPAAARGAGQARLSPFAASSPPGRTANDSAAAFRQPRRNRPRSQRAANRRPGQRSPTGPTYLPRRRAPPTDSTPPPPTAAAALTEAPAGTRGGKSPCAHPRRTPGQWQHERAAAQPISDDLAGWAGRRAAGEVEAG